MIEYDFSKCMYDISVAEGKLLKVFPEFNAYEEFVAAQNDNEIKISICLSDAESPFLKIKDYRQKTVAIFDYLGIDPKEAKNKSLFDGIVSYTHQRIYAICSIYLQMQNEHDFTYWWNMNQLYYSLMNEMSKPRLKSEDINKYVSRKLAIQKQAEPIKNDLLNVESNIFSDSKMKAAIAKAKLKSVRTYAEMYSAVNKGE